MPELPEVETVCRGLALHIVGRRIDGVIVRHRRLRKPVPADFAEKLVGKKITRVWRRAKYILISLQDGPAIIVHLGMSGVLRLADRPPGEKHEHWGIELDKKPGGKNFLLYRDPRRFGLVALCKTEPSRHPLLRSCGVEPFSEQCTVDYLHNILQHRRAAIKPVLMNGKIIAGVGNIYAGEALFAAGIHPAAAASSLGKKRLQKLVDSLRRVLREAIAAGGSTMRDFTGGDGEPGFFQMYWRVYGRAGERCRCGGVVRRLRQGGRTSFYCPRCQKK